MYKVSPWAATARSGSSQSRKVGSGTEARTLSVTASQIEPRSRGGAVSVNPAEPVE
jgi:hypothetical protein